MKQKNKKVHLLQADVGLEEDVRRVWSEFEAHQRENYGEEGEGAKEEDVAVDGEEGVEKEKIREGDGVKLHALVCNAGALLNDFTKTSEGVETTFASHLLFGTYLLTKLALPTLQNTPDSRVVVVSSGGMYNTAFPDWEVVTCRKGKYDGQLAYARAKRGQVLLCERWAELYPTGAPDAKKMKKRKSKKKVKSNENSGSSSSGSEDDSSSNNPAFVSCHPGWVDTPGVDAAYGEQKKYLEPLRNLWEGTDGIAWLCVAPRQQLVSGSYYLDRREAVKHIAGPFFSEGSYTKNTREEVDWMMSQLEKWSSSKTRPKWEVQADNSALNAPLKELQEKIELPSYMGRWHVVAGIPSGYEAGTVNNIEDYTLVGDDELEIAFSCYNKTNHKRSVLTQKGKMDNEYDTKWGLKFQKSVFSFNLLIPLPIPYLVLYVDRRKWKKEGEEDKGKEEESEGGEDWVEEEGGEYKHSLVGVPDRGYLWIMARDKDIGEKEMESLLDKAEEMGYDRLKIERMQYVDSIDVPPYGGAKKEDD
mmetsp:Transcript_2038/g.3183  ORF Transcript_2038/g.3183 Transcript_2038/m.3183 type:complete len:530 (-) Transcript_2038:49-1638(-)